MNVEQDWERVYTGGEAFSHILGYVGKISSEEMEKYTSAGKEYHSDSVVGKVGIEQYLEEQLQGIDGERTITINNVGKKIGEDEIVKEMVSGRDVYLSIDKDLQIAVYHILEQHLAGIIASNLVNLKRFDKTHLSDTSAIRIPIYDVYIALIENDVIRLNEFYALDATQLEQRIVELMDVKREDVTKLIRTELMEGNTDYDKLSEELQEYMVYIVNQLGVLDVSSIDQKDDIYQKWKNKKKISVKAFLMHAIESGWIADGFMEVKQGYFTTEEMYVFLEEEIENRITKDSKMDKLLLKWMILEDTISGKEICKLLYDQEVLIDTKGEYEKLESNQIEVFSFIKKKIEQLEITPAQLALDPCSASAVVIHPQTGNVLALVSYPGYDNNRLANQMDLDYYNRLLHDKSLPLYNRATQQLTAPGSTLKPITIIAGLQEGVIDPDTAIFCDGLFDKVVPGLKCWKHSGHQTVTNAPTALQFSCNDYMCEIAYRIGTENGVNYTDSIALKSLQKYTTLFNLDKKSGIEIAESQPHITDAYGIPSAIGQGTHNYATVQIARYISTIASRGNSFSLTLIKGIIERDGVLIENKALLEDKVILPDLVWDTVHMGMMQFAQNNTILKTVDLSIAGKTGTAQEAKNRPDHALFVGYAPAEQPEIALAVRIANGYGSSNATAIAKSIFTYYFGLESKEQIITGEASQAFYMRTD